MAWVNDIYDAEDLLKRSPKVGDLLICYSKKWGGLKYGVAREKSVNFGGSWSNWCFLSFYIVEAPNEKEIEIKNKIGV